MAMPAGTRGPVAPRRITRSAREPLYFQLRDLLLHRVEHEWKEGDRLPSEAQLCAEYGVSRTVVRQALSELDEAGVIYTVKGKGTFVTRPKVETNYVQNAGGFFDTMTRQGHDVTSSVFGSRVTAANPLVARALSLGIGETVVQLDRLRLLDGEPTCVVRGSYVARLVPGLETLELGGRVSLYAVLEERYGLRPASGRRTVEAGPIPKVDARLLGVRSGSPALILEGVMTAESGELFEYFRAIYRSDRFKLDVLALPQPHQS
ncbi:MAG: GntR family transcriptional regulator [Gaiellaceae bacterium]|jgi:GntR family transcriptional regulator